MAFVHTSNKTAAYRADNKKYVQKHLKQQHEAGDRAAVKASTEIRERVMKEAHDKGLFSE